MGKRWTTQDKHENIIYLTEERWQHIIDPYNHPEMIDFETHLKETIEKGHRKQDSLNLQKYRYNKYFVDLDSGNTHIIAMVLFRFQKGANSKPVPNNFIVTAFQKEIGL